MTVHVDSHGPLGWQDRFYDYTVRDRAILNSILSSSLNSIDLYLYEEVIENMPTIQKLSSGLVGVITGGILALVLLILFNGNGVLRSQITGTAQVNPGQNISEDQRQLLRDEASRLLRGQVTAEINAAAARFDGRADAFLQSQVDANSSALVNFAVGSFGADQGQLLNLWNERLALMNRYVDAARAYDPVALNQATSDLDAWANRAGDLATIYNLDRDAVVSILNANLSGFRGVIDAYAISDFDASSRRGREATDMAGSLASDFVDLLVAAAGFSSGGD